MAAGKKVDMSNQIDSVEEAIVNHEWGRARFLMAVRLGRMMDSTDSARDAKAVAMSLSPMVDKLEDEDNYKHSTTETPLADILKMDAANA